MPMLSVAQAQPNERAEFIKKTYIHLAGAVAAFGLLEYIFIQTGIAQVMAGLVSSSRFAWLAIIGAFAVLGWISRGLAAKADDENLQYLGLGLYVAGYALIFAPLIYIAAFFSDPSVLPTAGILTAFMFGGLTMIAFTTKRDFSFLGGFLRIGGLIALGLIICSALFGFTLGLLFSAVMVGFASCAILYDTSKVMHHFSTRHHVAASLELFASVALLFWYVLQLVMSRR